MQFFSSSQQAWSTAKLPMTQVQRPRANGGNGVNAKAEVGGWFDSSFDLATGLEVSEQDNDTLYQLWELSQR
ncbi:MAG: hypothetical protein ACT6S0_10625 [Roseateles sp.]|uniref:hypothetical protein n=1 Tax=Roseateles sp. TaxID=1971397 RepID=UPI004037414E